jgi:nicotinate phosphoribosyltransferase
MKRSDQSVAEGILFTDQYQLTMAQLYYRMGLHEKFAQFDYFFRSYPNYGSHKAGYCVSAGLEWLLDWMREARFRDQDLEYLHSQTDRTGKRIFEDDFLTWLRENGTFSDITMRAVPDGPDSGNVTAQPSELPNADRYQGCAHPRKRPGAVAAGVWIAPGARAGR